jgi:hypothetical protein
MRYRAAVSAYSERICACAEIDSIPQHAIVGVLPRDDNLNVAVLFLPDWGDSLNGSQTIARNSIDNSRVSENGERGDGATAAALAWCAAAAR